MYKALRLERKEIRLLRFTKPLDQDSRTIHCSLVTTPLVDTPRPVYIALSYLWGPPIASENPLFKVYVDSRLFSVAGNLMLALVHLNLRCDEHVPLWIDAICINQADAVERGHQVTLMREIYTNAFHVWAWQIPISECDLGMDLISEATQHLASRQGQGSRRWPLISTTWLKSQLNNPTKQETWRSFIKLLEQPYWRRSWIIQELYVGTNVTVICGEKMARMGLLFGIVAGLVELSLRDEIQHSSLLSEIYVASWYVSQIALLIDGSPDTLSGLVERFTSSSATDPRDKIYSLIGIAKQNDNNNNNNNRLLIDYTVEWPEVFMRAARYIIRDDGDLNILASAASGSSELPSWVPNFADQSVHRISTDLNEFTPGAVTMPAKAFFNAGGNDVPLARVTAMGKRLTVKVILVHTLSFILPQRHFGAQLGPIEELRRRLRFLIGDYVTSTNRRNDIPESFSLEVGAYICIRFYQATFYTTYLPAMVERIWPLSDFVQFAIKCIPGGGSESDCTEAQLRLLRSSLSGLRSLFFCELKVPFSLEEDFKTTRANIETIEPGVLSSLRHCKFQVPGYCRNQDGWGQNGDIVSVVLGCNVPLLLRPVSKAGELPLVMRVISEAYVYGLMSGEAIDKLPAYEITLV